MGEQQFPTPQFQQRGNVIYADQLGSLAQQLHTVVKMITDIPASLPLIRRKFRGEALYQTESGENIHVQMFKPRFVKIDFDTGLPIKQKVTMPWKGADGKNEVKEVFVPNDEAIEEILTMLSFMGINEITPITNLSPEDIVDDLREFEMALSSILTLKQQEWGIDKEIRPMIFQEIKTLIQDVRYMARQGQTLKQINTNVQRMEQVIEGDRRIKLGATPYG